MSLRLCDKPIYDFRTQSIHHWLAILGIISSTWIFVGGKGGSVYAYISLVHENFRPHLDNLGCH